MNLAGQKTSRGLLPRAMTPADIPGGLRLCRASNWNQLGEDWRYILEAEGGGGRLVERDGVVVGTAAFLRYGGEFAWLSMMLVDPAERRAGLGSQLLDAALAALENIPCVRLDATPLGEPLYRRYGFVPERMLARTSVIVDEARWQRPANTRLMREEDFAEVFAQDRAAFGADRSGLLASFFRREPRYAWVSEESGQISGYCFGRPGYLYEHLGPVVAGNPDAARRLVSACLSQQGGKTFAVDVPQDAAWMEWLKAAGLVVERPFLRMRRGATREAEKTECQFAIAGPEFG